MNSVQNTLRKIKSVARIFDRRTDIFLAAVMILLGVGCFGLGRLSAMGYEPPPLRFENADGTIATGEPITLPPSASAGDTATDATYVASSKGTIYYLPSCAGAKKIKEENKIWFASADEARRAGYEPAKNCGGM